MKRKPDILVVLAALLGLGMILSSFSGASTFEWQKNLHIVEVFLFKAEFSRFIPVIPQNAVSSKARSGPI